jgi:hypothetical protein
MHRRHKLAEGYRELTAGSPHPRWPAPDAASRRENASLAKARGTPGVQDFRRLVRNRRGTWDHLP